MPQMMHHAMGLSVWWIVVAVWAFVGVLGLVVLFVERREEPAAWSPIRRLSPTVLIFPGPLRRRRWKRDRNRSGRGGPTRSGGKGSPPAKPGGRDPRIG